MRFVFPLGFAFAFALISGCATTREKHPDAALPASQPEASASDPGTREVFDPVAPGSADPIPGAVFASADAPERPNTLAPGFLIRLGHQEDRDINGTYRINFDGKIDLPYNVSFRAQGLTLEEFRQKVTESYKPFFKSGVRITVDLVEKTYFVEMRGLISKPGKYKVRADSSLDEVIALGGGLPAMNNGYGGNNVDNQPHFIKISRGETTRLVNLEEYYKSGSLKEKTSCHGGEVLFFQKESAVADLNSLDVGTQVQVLGELKRPGEFGHRPGADVYSYLADAGGPTRDTDFDKVQIYRGAPGKRVMMEFELEQPEKVPAVQPGDILVFHADKPTRFQKNVGTAANIATVLTAIALLIIAL